MPGEPMEEKKHTKIVIEGVNAEGQPFRPADWAERMSGSLSTFRNRRIIYSPLLQPAMKNGNKCMIVDDDMKDTHPELYKEIMEFAEKNRLKVEKKEDDTE
jgi:hypothetical protein